VTTPVLSAVDFVPPLLNPAPYGLYPAVIWTDEPGPTRYLAAGVQFRPINYVDDGIGVWGQPWCGPAGSPASGEAAIKWGTRPELPDPFPPMTIWAYDECDPTPASRTEVLTRVQQILRMGEPVVAETMFGAALRDAVTEAGIAVTRPSVREGVAYLEGVFARTNTLGVLHASAEAAAMEFGMVLPAGPVQKTPLGHTWALGGGYVDTLDNLMVATSPVFGWRDTVQVRPVLDPDTNTYAAVAERSVVLGYEKLIGAVYVDVLEGS